MSLTTLLPLLPELTIAVGAMVLLMLGVMRPPSDNDGEPITWLALIILIAAGAILVLQPGGTSLLFDGAWRIDAFGRFMKLLVLGGAGTALLMAVDEFKDLRSLRFEFPVLILLATVGMLLMVSANDLLSLYLGLELQSLSLYVVAAWRRDSVRSSEAGLKYFVLGALSSGMLLYGASLIYGFTGSTSFDAIAKAAAGAGGAQNIGLTFGLVFLLVGIAFKISAVPFHMWTPDVYEGAPTPVTAFFAAAPKVAAMALLMRVTLGAFSGIAQQWQQIVVFLSIASMVLGAFAAIGQTNIKRLMAYSSIANVGFALVPLAAGTREGAEGVLVYMAIYVIMTLGTFACILSMRREDMAVEEIDELAGLAETNLPMAFVLAMLMFSLAGIPPLAGFWAKFYAFLPVIKAGGSLTYLAIIGVVSSVVGAYYYLRIVKIMFFDAARDRFQPVRAKAGLVMLAAGIAVIGFVVWPSWLIAAAGLAAQSFRL